MQYNKRAQAGFDWIYSSCGSRKLLALPTKVSANAPPVHASTAMREQEIMRTNSWPEETLYHICKARLGPFFSSEGSGQRLS